MSDWVFVTGGSGYVGSHVSAHLKTATDYSVMLIDRRGNFLPHTTRYCDVFADEDFSSDVVLQAIRDYRPSCIIHCADDPLVENGIQDPLEVWNENVIKTIKLLKSCAYNSVPKFIFLSTSQVYLDDNSLKTETSTILPNTTYGRTKIGIEHLLKDCYVAHGISSLSIRTFNIAGSHNVYDLGQLRGAPHLVPNAMESLVHGKTLEVFGNKFNTPDGTPVRDWLHVMDLADAIVSSIKWLDSNQGSHSMNIGSGNQASVIDMINQCESLFGKNITYAFSEKRHYDPPYRLVESAMLRKSLVWTPKRTIRDILLDSFKWYNSYTYKNLVDMGVWHI